MKTPYFHRIIFWRRIDQAGSAGDPYGGYGYYYPYGYRQTEPQEPPKGNEVSE